MVYQTISYTCAVGRFMSPMTSAAASRALGKPRGGHLSPFPPTKRQTHWRECLCPGQTGREQGREPNIPYRRRQADDRTALQGRMRNAPATFNITAQMAQWIVSDKEEMI